VRKAQLEQAEKAFHPLIAEFDAIVQIVQQRARLDINGDVPYPAGAFDLAPRADRHLDREKMRDPALEHTAERVERRGSSIQAHGEIEMLVTPPVLRRIVLRQYIEVDGSRRRALRPQSLAHAAERAGTRDGV